MKRHLTALALLGTSATAQDLSTTIPPEVAAVSPALQAYATDALHGTVWTADSLNTRDRALVTFAAMVTRGESAQLGAFTAMVLDAGITPAELSETITHLAFYTGWGNATGAAIAMSPVFAERGIAPDQLPGANPDLLPLDEEAEAARQDMVQGNYGTTSQDTVDYTEQMLFRDLWLRPDLAPRDRSLVTVAALVAAGQPEQMTFHLNRAMDNGLTKAEAGGVLGHLAFYAGWPRVFSALPVAKDVLENRPD